MTGHPLRRKFSPDGLTTKPVLPTASDMAILRRAAAGHIFVTLTESGPIYRYDDGSVVSLRDGKYGKRQFEKLVAEGWLIPDQKDSLFEGGAPQIYRARKP